MPPSGWNVRWQPAFSDFLNRSADPDEWIAVKAWIDRCLRDGPPDDAVLLPFSEDRYVAPIHGVPLTARRTCSWTTSS